MTKTKKADNPILVVIMGRSHKMEIGPRTSDPGYPTYIRFAYWDIQRTGKGAGPDTPMCAIKLTRKWFEDYIEGRVIHEWLNTYDKLLSWLAEQGSFSFGCPVCGALVPTLEQYENHLEVHRAILADF